MTWTYRVVWRKLRAEKLNEAESAYRKILAIAPNHVQSLIGLGEICTARGEKKDTSRFSEAVEYYTKAMEVAEQEKIRSKYLTKQEKAAIHYSLGYARVELYEKSAIHREISVLKHATSESAGSSTTPIRKLSGLSKKLKTTWLTSLRTG